MGRVVGRVGGGWWARVVGRVVGEGGGARCWGRVLVMVLGEGVGSLGHWVTVAFFLGCPSGVDRMRKSWQLLTSSVD